jgi:hypothetical protein
MASRGKTVGGSCGERVFETPALSQTQISSYTVTGITRRWGWSFVFENSGWLTHFYPYIAKYSLGTPTMDIEFVLAQANSNGTPNGDITSLCTIAASTLLNSATDFRPSLPIVKQYLTGGVRYVIYTIYRNIITHDSTHYITFASCLDSGSCQGRLYGNIKVITNTNEGGWELTNDGHTLAYVDIKLNTIGAKLNDKPIYEGVLYIWNGSAWVPKPMEINDPGFTAHPVYACLDGSTWSLIQSF